MVEQAGSELGGDEGFDPQGYLAANGGRLLVLMCQPAEPRDDLAYLQSFVEPIRGIVAEEAAKQPGVTVGVTGMPAFTTEEMGVINTDLSFITLVSAVGVLLLFVLGYGSLWNTLFIALTLALGVLVDLALTAAFVGSVNLVSSLFVAVLLGLGIDYGIQLITRLQEELRGGASAAEAVRTAVVHTRRGRPDGRRDHRGGLLHDGPRRVQAAHPARHRGRRRDPSDLSGLLRVLAGPAHFARSPSRAPFVRSRRAALRALAAAGASLAGAACGRHCHRPRPPRHRVLIALPIRPITFANDQLSMLPQDLPSVTWLRKLENTGMFTSAFNASIAPNLEEARRREAAFGKLATVSRVQSLATLPAGRPGGEGSLRPAGPCGAPAVALPGRGPTHRRRGGTHRTARGAARLPRARPPADTSDDG